MVVRHLGLLAADENRLRVGDLIARVPLDHAERRLVVGCIDRVAFDILQASVSDFFHRLLVCHPFAGEIITRVRHANNFVKHANLLLLLHCELELFFLPLCIRFLDHFSDEIGVRDDFCGEILACGRLPALFWHLQRAAFLRLDRLYRGLGLRHSLLKVPCRLLWLFENRLLWCLQSS